MSSRAWRWLILVMSLACTVVCIARAHWTGDASWSIGAALWGANVGIDAMRLLVMYRIGWGRP